MSFSAKQIQALRRQPDSRYIRTRDVNGRELSYLEGWYAVSEANRIFGFDGWSRETVDSRCVLVRENRGSFLAVYAAKVRITVNADGVTVIREGHGTGEGRANTPGEVHDTALKAAETDATKRALATFGRPFGLELYKAGRTSSKRDVRLTREAPADSPSRYPRASTGEQLSQADRGGAAQKGSPPSAHRAAGVEAVTELGFAATKMRADRTDGLNAALTHGTRPEAPLIPADVSSFVPSKIDKNVLTFGEPKRIRDKAHLKFVASQPCLICARQPCDAHHLRFAQPQALGRKVSDEFTVPLCRGHHRELHQMGDEPAWWHGLGINALEIAKGLWEQSRLGLIRPSDTAIAAKGDVPEADR